MTAEDPDFNNFQRKLIRADAYRETCVLPECPEPTSAVSLQGINQRFCRKHYEHYQRHGSPYRGSYKAAELQSARKVAKAWLRSNHGSQGVLAALERIRILYRSAGPHVPAYHLKGLSPKERARKAWARLRGAQVKPEKILLAWIAIGEAIRTDPNADSKPEFKRVQAAKLVHRLASGTHKRWERERADGSKHLERLDVYPRSRGQVLRVLGEDVERAMEPLGLD